MISIIIPVFNEAETIVKTIDNLRERCAEVEVEIIIIDGGSTDDTIALAEARNVKVVSGRKGRARQMNYGASFAQHEILYFLHADSQPPRNFCAAILNAQQRGFVSGCFRLKFDLDHWFLKANSWFTKFNVNAVRFGDQSLFITKEIFQKSGGFREDLIVMEDQEIIHRIKEQGKFIVMNDYLITSARKYLENGIYRMQGIFYCIWALYYLGFSQQSLVNVYKRLIKQNKI